MRKICLNPQFDYHSIQFFLTILKAYYFKTELSSPNPYHSLFKVLLGTKHFLKKLQENHQKISNLKIFKFYCEIKIESKKLNYI